LLGTKKPALAYKPAHEMNSEERQEMIYQILERAAAAGDIKIVNQCTMCIEVIERWIPIEDSIRVQAALSSLAGEN